MGKEQLTEKNEEQRASFLRDRDSIAPAKAHVSKKSLGTKIHDLRPSVKLCLSIIIVLTLATLFAEWVAPYDPYEPDLEVRNRPPSLQHVLGTDQIGRDTLSRTIFALRTSVGIAMIGVLCGTLIGTTFGISAGLFGGWTDRILSSIIDFFYAVPNILIMLVGIAVFGTKTWVLIALISFARWHSTARLVRGQVFSLREVPSVEAAVALGSSRWRVAVKHILPNLTSIIVVNMTLKFPAILLLESTLSFLGLGVQPPLASLGAMVGEGRDYLISTPLIALTPAFVMVAIVMCFQVLGDWLRDVSDVRHSD
ncbi:MAG: ABC transporter permease [Candidatus Hydrogenedentes bacterium]|nr:ABC transporter permease [Candidatus Hydrogenedentota bacterium]